MNSPKFVLLRTVQAITEGKDLSKMSQVIKYTPEGLLENRLISMLL